MESSKSSRRSESPASVHDNGNIAKKEKRSPSSYSKDSFKKDKKRRDDSDSSRDKK